MQFPPSSPFDPRLGGGESAAAPTDWGTHNLPHANGPDPYRPAIGWRIGLGVISLILLVMVVIIQRPQGVPPDRAAKRAAGLEERFSPSLETAIVAKIYFGTRSLLAADPTFGPMMQDSVDSAAGFETSGGGFSMAPAPSPDDPPASAITRIHAAVLAGETLGPDQALSRLEKTEPQIDAASPLIKDVQVLRRIYGGEAPAEVSASLNETERKEFLDRNGLFGELALSYGDPAAEVRIKAAKSGLIVVVSAMCFGLAAMVAGFVGLGMLIYFFVLLSGGRLRPRFVEPASLIEKEQGPTSWGWSMDPQGRLVWLETVAVFLAGFLVLSVSGDLLAAKFAGQTWVAFYALIGQWMLVLTLFWPVARGMPWKRWRGELGWHRGEGFFAEVGAGLMAYLASLPIYFLMAIFVAVLIMIAKFAFDWNLAPEPEDNKLLDLAASGNPILIMLIFLLATLWAPIVEESIFRGALYRHTRWVFSPVFAGLLTAFVFAIMHGYAVIQLLMIGLLGMIFALIREWRGSLIGPMTAHFTHNTIVMTFVIILFGQLGS